MKDWLGESRDKIGVLGAESNCEKYDVEANSWRVGNWMMFETDRVEDHGEYVLEVGLLGDKYPCRAKYCLYASHLTILIDQCLILRIT
jgi:hypothetical protein